MIHTTDISKDFILNKAVHHATNILLRPYMPIILSESNSRQNIYETKYEAVSYIKDKWISQSQEFLLRMATIAWDFLNVSNMFENNLARQNIEKDILNNNI